MTALRGHAAGLSSLLVLATSASAGADPGAAAARDRRLAACSRLLDAYAACTVTYRRDPDGGNARCAGLAGPPLHTCLLAEAEAFGDGPEQIEALKALGAARRHVKSEMYGLKMDAGIARACQVIVRELPALGVVRRAAVTSACRSARYQARMIVGGSKLAAQASNHNLCLACDVHVTGYRRYNTVVAAARRVIEKKLGRPFSRQVRIWKEPTIRAMHIHPNFARSPEYRAIRAARIGRLIAVGTLPPGTSTERTPNHRLYADARRWLRRRKR